MQEPNQTIEERIGGVIGDEFEDEDNQYENEDSSKDEVNDNALQEEGQEEQEEQDSDEEAFNVTSLKELADHLEVDVADLYNLQIPALLPDGSKRNISIGEWKDSYQESQLIKRDRERYQREAEEQNQQIQQRVQYLDASLSQAALIIQSAEKQLMGEIDGLEKLQSTDPTQYVMRKQQLTERMQEIDRLKQQAIQHYQYHNGEIARQQEEYKKQYLTEQYQKLPEVIPEWKDEAIATKEKQEIAQYLLANGIPENVVSTLSDAVQVSIARKAMLFDKMQKVDTATKKKAIKIGKKVIKSGSKPSKKAVNVSKLNQARSNLRKASNKREADDIVGNILGEFFLDDMR